jgi:hypothetical protein
MRVSSGLSAMRQISACSSVKHPCTSPMRIYLEHVMGYQLHVCRITSIWFPSDGCRRTLRANLRRNRPASRADPRINNRHMDGVLGKIIHLATRKGRWFSQIRDKTSLGVGHIPRHMGAISLPYEPIYT